MADHHAPTTVSEDAIARAQSGWSAFTAITVRVCIATAIALAALVALLTR